MFKRSILTTVIITTLSACGGSGDSTTTTSDTPVPAPPPAPTPTPAPAPDPTQIDGYTLVWQEEFDGPAVNPEIWNYETGDGTDFDLPPGWGNDELQIYTTDAANVSIAEHQDESVLMIVAREASPGEYTSARLTTEDKFSVRYGKVIGRIKLPEGQGLWPAFWMLGDNIDEISWPGSGEIDIMELVGHKPSETFHTIHYVNADLSYTNNGRTYTNATKFSENFHEFELDWTPDSLTFSVDGNIAHSVMITDDMKEFQRSMHLLLNVAVGGRLPGSPDSTTVFPQTMYVDYIRVYAQNDFTPPPSPPLVPEEETVGGSGGDANPGEAILSGFDDFGSLSFARFGAGGEPEWLESTDAIDGTASIEFSYPGGNWGGAWLLSEQPVDLTALSDASLVFALKRPDTVTRLEIKLEGANQSSDGSLFLENYESTDLGDGWEEFRIPLADFVADGLLLDKVVIPFALWNPMTDDGQFPQASILFDAVRIE